MLGRRTLLIAVAAGGVALLIATTVISCGEGDGATPTAPTSATATDRATRAIPPNNLVAPIDQTSISRKGAPINPFGIVRSALDQGPVGHPGLDLPSAAGTPALAATMAVVASTPTSLAAVGVALVGWETGGRNEEVSQRENARLIAGIAALGARAAMMIAGGVTVPVEVSPSRVSVGYRWS